MLRMKKTIKLGGVAFAAMLALAPVVSSNVVQADTSKPAVQATKRNKMKTKCAPRLIFVYDKDGNFAVSNYRYVYFKKGKNIQLWNNAKIIKINGEKYYQIGDNQYVKVSDLKKMRKHHKVNKNSVKNPAWNKKLGIDE